MTKPLRIWYTKGLRNTAAAILLIKSSSMGSRVVCLASHVLEQNPIQNVADEWFLEPTNISDEDYVQWVLQTAIERKVDHVIAQRRPAAFDEWRAAFAEVGVTLSVPASANTLDRLDNKSLFYQDMDDLGLPTCAHQSFTTHIDFINALLEIKKDPRAEHGLCIKPARGIYGSGFRILKDGDEFSRLLEIDCLEISLATFVEFLVRSEQKRHMLLMSLLPGIERSVDFLAHNGEFVSGVARAKHGREQVVETTGASIEYARFLTKHYNLHGICNLQTKDVDGVPHLLEINPRMSGGFAMSCAAGVNMPLWHLLLSHGQDTIANVPAPMPIRVTREEIVQATPILS